MVRVMTSTIDLHGHPLNQSTVEQLMTEAQYAEHLADRAKAKADALARMRAVVAKQPGGSDRFAEVHRFPRPSEEELRANLMSVRGGFQLIPMADLRAYLPTGLPPQDLPAAQLAKYRTGAERQLAKAKAMNKGLVALIPPEQRARYEAYTAKQSAEPLVACKWLNDKMELLCVHPGLVERQSFLFGRQAQGASPEMQWIDAIRMHNGFCKTVLELRQHMMDE